MEYTHYKFRDICEKNGMVRGPFGSALKKSLFVPKGSDTYKVYEQCVPLEQDKNSGHYYISGDYFRQSLKRFEVRDNDFLVSCSGVNYGAIYHLQAPFERGVINQALLIIRVDSSLVDYNYFKYLFRAILSKAIIAGGSDSTIPNFPSMDVIKDVDVYLPPLEDQKRIGNLLDLLDKRISKNKAVNDNLQQQIKLIYNYWFSQFDFPNTEGLPYKSSGGAMEYSDRLKCYIPLGWTVESVIDNCISTPIKPGVEAFYKKTYLATADVNGTTISSGLFIDYENREGRANMQPTASSVWFAKMKNSIKHLYLNKQMQPIIDSTILSTGFCGLQCSAQSFEYMAAFIEHSYFESMKDVLAHGATQESVNNDDLLGLVMVVPKKEILDLFHRRTEPMYAQISKNICENQRLNMLRDWLLPMLMNGQVKVIDSMEDN